MHFIRTLTPDPIASLGFSHTVLSWPPPPRISFSRLGGGQQLTPVVGESGAICFYDSFRFCHHYFLTPRAAVSSCCESQGVTLAASAGTTAEYWSV